MTDNYNGSQVLFRMAKARAISAKKFAAQADSEIAQGGNGMERRQRERDAVIAVLVFTQGAAEAYSNWVHLEAQRKIEHSEDPQSLSYSPGRSWIDHWETLPAAAEVLDRPGRAALSAEHKAFLERLGAWRNYLLHADRKARDRLLGQIAPDTDPETVSVPDLLTADRAHQVLTDIEPVFGWAQDVTGIQAPFLAGAWVAFDE